MLTPEKRQANIYFGGAVAAFLVAEIIVGAHFLPEGVGNVTGTIVLTACAILWLLGCAKYAEAKGHHPAWGLVGLLFLLGVVILFFLSDRNRELSPKASVV